MDDALSLAEVVSRFRAAEDHLREMSSAADQLASNSQQLDGARVSLDEVNAALRSYVDGLAAVTQRLGAATAVIEQIDPSEITRRLDAQNERLDAHNERLDDLGRKSDDADTMATAARAGLSQVVNRLQMLLIVNIVLVVAVIVMLLVTRP